MKKYAVLSLSGGMDSSTLLLNLLKNGYEVTALSFDYGQKHRIELEKAKELVYYLNDNYYDTNHRGDDFGKYYRITHQVIKLEGLSQLLNSSLVVGGDEVPEGHYQSETMKSTVVPNRNKIFSSIIQSVALSISEKNKTECSIAMGIHAGDHDIYPDCRKEFRDVDFEAFILGNWGGENVKLYTPYLLMDKYGILVDGKQSCDELDLNFDEVYKRTITSYKPISFREPTGFISRPYETKWYSDFKSSSSVERIEAFIKLGIPDPTPYADQLNPVAWEVAKEYVENL